MNKRLSRRLVAAAGTAALVLVTMPAAEAVTSTTYENDVQKRTNTKRVERDRVALKKQTCIDNFAEKQAAKMARNQELKHQSLGPIMSACGLTGVAENIAYGFPSGNAVVTGWMNSSGHRKNLLNSKMRLFGTGAVQDANGVWWVAQVLGKK